MTKTEFQNFEVELQDAFEDIELLSFISWDDQQSTINQMQDAIDVMAEALIAIAEKRTCEKLYGENLEKYNSYEDGWYGVSEYAGNIVNNERVKPFLKGNNENTVK